MDEATTGLDSMNALKITKTVRKLRNKGETVICSVSQPSKRIMEHFDHVIVLADG